MGSESLTPLDDYSVQSVGPFRSVSMIYSWCCQLPVLSWELMNIDLNEGMMQAEPEHTFACVVCCLLDSEKTWLTVLAPSLEVSWVTSFRPQFPYLQNGGNEAAS